MPGPKAKNEFEYFTGKAAVLETKIDIVSPGQPAALNPEPELEPALLAELFKRGSNAKQAAALLLEIRPDQDAMEQLEYADYRIASEPAGTFRNPPGFYISVIRDNTPAPSTFESSRKRSERELGENRRVEEHQAIEQLQLELEAAFAEYRRAEVETYIARSLAPGEYAAMVEEQKRSYVAQFRNAAHWPAETLHSIAINAAAAEICRRAPLLTFEEFRKKAL